MSTYNSYSPSQHWSPTFRPGSSRPGILTAVGVMSIIVASLTIVASLLGGLWTMAMYQTTRVVATQARSAAAGSTAATPATLLPTPEELEGQSAAKRLARKMRRDGLLDLLAAVRPMSPAVRMEVDGMLARYAERIVPPHWLTAAEVSTSDVRSAIDSSGSLPPVQAGDTEGLFISFKETGRLEAYGNRAVFIPADGSGRLRTSGQATPAEEDTAIALAEVDAINPQPTANNGTTPAVANAPPANPSIIYPSGLNGAQVQSIVQKAQATIGGGLNPAQIGSVTNALQTQTPPLVQSQMVYSPIRLAKVNPDGSAMIAFSNGTVFVDANGSILQQFNNNLQEVTVDPIGMTLMIGEAIVALLLAFFLLVSGILVLRNSPRGAGAHWTYALFKLPLAILGAVAFAWVMQDIVSGVGRLGGGGNQGSNTPGVIAVWIGIAGVVYPIALMIVMSLKNVREYYQTLQT